MELETRELRYFKAVADAGGVGRAAEDLHLTQAPLSRAIQQLERRLGVRLFDRHARGVTLTPAGEVLLAESHTVLDAAAAAVERTRRAGDDGARRLVLATKAAANPELLRGLLDAYAAGTADPVRVDVELCGPEEQLAMLRDGRADAAIVHEDYDRTAGLRTSALGVEPLVAVLPADHELASRDTLALEEVGDLPIAGCQPHDDDHGGLVVRDMAQLAEAVALGRAMAVLPASATALLWDAHATVPIEGAPTVTTVIAWPAGAERPALTDLVGAARGAAAVPA